MIYYLYILYSYIKFIKKLQVVISSLRYSIFMQILMYVHDLSNSITKFLRKLIFFNLFNITYVKKYSIYIQYMYINMLKYSIISS